MILYCICNVHINNNPTIRRQTGWRPTRGITIKYQHTPSSLVACSVGLNDSPGNPRQEEILGAELVNKGEPQNLSYLNSYSKPW